MAKKIKKIKGAPTRPRKTRKVSGLRGVPSQQSILLEAKAFHQAGHLTQAEALYQQILSREPDHPDALHFLGVLAHQVGKSGIAVELIGKALRLRPDSVEAHNNLANALLAQGKLDEAVTSYRRAISFKPDYAEAHYNLGVVLYAQGKLDEAIASYRRAITIKPDYAEAHYNLGLALKNRGKLNEAITSYRQAIFVRPDFAEAYHNLGVVFSELGKMDDAIACHKKALSLKPDYVLAYKSLSAIVKYTEVDDVIRAMERLYNKKSDISDVDREDLGFTLGKVFEDIGDYDKSFTFILEANQLKRRSYEYSIHNDHELFERIKKTFSPDFFASHHGSGNQDRTPIFIIGMPRSGTTLVEQILSSHPMVFGAGELTVLENLINSICTGGAKAHFPECMPELSEEVLERVGAHYVEEIRGYSKDAKHITDKMPHNFLYVGFIKMILPNAKVIHCMRNPMDNCFSIFKNDFKGTVKYAYDMVELGKYYNLYRDLMAYWEKVLPGFVYPLRYEEMVSNQQHQTKSLLDFCGLPWDEVCLAFHKTERRISTVSLAQVRQPIYKDSIESWKRYEKQLEPLRKTVYG